VRPVVDVGRSESVVLSSVRPCPSSGTVVRPTGTPQYAYSYEPYGGGAGADPAPLTATAPANPLRFTGAYLDPTGSYHLRARQYDPGTGRFDGTDPATPALTAPRVSPYVYVDDQPTALVDPTGECGPKAWLKSLRPHFGKSACQREDEARCTVNGRSIAATDADCAIAAAENAATSPEAAIVFVAILSLPILLDTLGPALEGTSLAGGVAICRQTLAKIFGSLSLGGTLAEAEAGSQAGKTRGSGAGAGGARPDAGHKYAARVYEGGRPDGETVFAGHGTYRPGDGFTRIPEGTRSSSTRRTTR
jgi:RHS repeat-associated protein